MFYIADLHVHSHYSRATSKNLNLESLYQWARIKGIQVVGTGDFTHPLWFKELQEKLEPDGYGFYRLKNPPADPYWPGMKCKEDEVRFCLSTEISSIYKKGDKVRKNHNLLYAPNLETVAKLNARLATIGNLKSDGRPILGLPSRDLLEIALEISEELYFIPAHIWTPWFSTFGSKSGYDQLEECFEDLTEYIFALETGLSSDPEMNWQWSALDRYTLVSNSDAHSPQKLGREANLFDTERSYQGMFEAIKSQKGFLGTYEFFPEEGKYHLDGHRKCGVVLDPQDSLQYQGLCPACGKPLTLGVLHRVQKLADRSQPERPTKAADFHYIVPLPEVISEIKGIGPNSKGVLQNYQQLISAFGNEFSLLREVPIEDIEKQFGILTAEAIRRIRSEEVRPISGYDGQYGVIQIFEEGEMDKLAGQLHFFQKPSPSKKEKNEKYASFKKQLAKLETENQSSFIPTLNPAQAAVLATQEGATLVKAGPGTGKTRTLIEWIKKLVEDKKAKPSEILAITFTQKAAQEMQQRLRNALGDGLRTIQIGTFHAIAYAWLKERFPQLETIYDQRGRQIILEILFPEAKKKQIQAFSQALEHYWEQERVSEDQEVQRMMQQYQDYLQAHQALDLSAIIARLLQLWEKEPTWLEKARQNCQYVAVDELQDINRQQYRFLEMLSQGKNILAIGDPDQAIYGFRGGEVRLFFQFEKDFQAQVLSLEQNYRSSQNIVEAARHLIKHNQVSSELHLFTEREAEAKIKLFRAEHETMEAKYIVSQIEQYIGGLDNLTTGVNQGESDLSFSDIAILFRQRSVLPAITEQLRKGGIPFHLGAGNSPLQEAPFSRITDMIHLYLNPQDAVALYALLKNTLEWPEATVRKLLPRIKSAQTALAPAWSLELNQDQQQAWTDWQKFYTSLPNFFQNQGVLGAVQKIFEQYIPDNHLDTIQLATKEIILELAREAQADPEDFLQKLTLDAYTDTGRFKTEGVHLLTFHAAKGLEFPVVFVMGAEEGITPSHRSDVEVEEERRLFYVALTRAEQHLQITHASRRKIFGQEQIQHVSRFIGEIPMHLIETVAVRKRKPTKKKPDPNQDQLPLF